MVNIIKNTIINFIIIFVLGCSSYSISEQERVQLNYNEGLEFYNKGKYSKAREAFKYVILHSMGSRLALESEFYLSESLYNLGEYEDALYGYDNYARSAQDPELIELARFRICQCSFNLTVDYKKDQAATVDALEKFEIFLEDYSDSEYYSEIISIKSDLIYRLAKKEYESAVLYIKMQEYKAALIYLFNVLNNYYPLNPYQISDTQTNKYDSQLKELLDNTKIMIIYSYLFDEKSIRAKEFYDLQMNDFYNLKSKDKANKLLELDNLNKINIWKDIYWGLSK